MKIMEDRPEVSFHGTTYLFIGDFPHEGALATQEAYEHGHVSFAHLMADGRILRYGVRAGNREDLTQVGTAHVTVAEGALENILQWLS